MVLGHSVTGPISTSRVRRATDQRARRTTVQAAALPLAELRVEIDLVNLLAGVQIAIVFLTNDLRIRQALPDAAITSDFIVFGACV